MNPNNSPFDVLNSLTAVSATDGRYSKQTRELSEYTSELALMKYRIYVEVEYFIALAGWNVIRNITEDERSFLRKLSHVSLQDGERIKEIEKITNHDVKAVEYFIKEKLAGTSLQDVVHFIHWGLTSEDVDNIAKTIMVSKCVAMLKKKIYSIRKTIQQKLIEPHTQTPMLCLTHGQPATPKIWGNEMKVYDHRLNHQASTNIAFSLLVKLGGPTGQLNAHYLAVADMNWMDFADGLVSDIAIKEDILMQVSRHTSQIEPHDSYAMLFNQLSQVNTILLDFCRDIWQYISMGWIVQKPKEGEVGSSAMPHKVNPIDFENAEGNLGMANAMFRHFSEKLPISRLQRDLSDSTVQRYFGEAFGKCLIAYNSIEKGLGKINVDTFAMLDALNAQPEVLTEPYQVYLKYIGREDAYEKMKDLSRGNKITLDDLHAFVNNLDIEDRQKQLLLKLTPANYALYGFQCR